MNQQEVEREYHNEQLRQMNEQVKVAKKAREKKLKQSVGSLLNNLYTLK